MLRSPFFRILLIDTICFYFGFVQGRFEDDEDLRYMVGLSEPLQSSLEWDYDATRLIFRWNITLTNGYSGILAFSNYDWNTSYLDVILFSKDEKLCNAYTDENSLLYIPKDTVQLSYSILNRVDIKNKPQKQYTIRIIRPIDTCDEQKRNYIIDRGTTHLLTGSMTPRDFQKLKQGEPIKVDRKQMSLMLQRVQLLKSEVVL